MCSDSHALVSHLHQQRSALLRMWWVHCDSHPHNSDECHTCQAFGQLQLQLLGVAVVLASCDERCEFIALQLARYTYTAGYFRLSRAPPPSL
ncbi:hypothetical protein [Aliagarivorans marinus]|uniref:hypothetical protein n=1 Tax=Aliagarivorans marinus TaxID=561965 RepID=UPI00047B4F94|nr:hypothetical protein [Aliagarivorans marinus]